MGLVGRIELAVLRGVLVRRVRTGCSKKRLSMSGDGDSRIRSARERQGGRAAVSHSNEEGPEGCASAVASSVRKRQ